MSRMFLTVAAISLAAPIAASAQEGAARATGVYARGGAGIAFGEDLSQDLTWNPFWAYPAVVGYPPIAKATELGEGLALSAAFGFQYARTRTELEYRRMEASVNSINYSSSFGPAFVNDDLVAQALMSNVYFDFVNSSAFTPYLGVGVGGARVENELGERDAAFAYQGRAGVEVALGDRLSIGAEYVYFRTMDIVYGPKDKEFTPTSHGEPRTDGDPFVSSSVMGTVRLVF